MALALAILGAIPAIYGIITFFQKLTAKTEAQKVQDDIVKGEDSIAKAKATGDTSDIEKYLNS